MTDTNIISALTSDAEIFRQKVIDAGIQGKLTEQRPEDGNARELFAQIQTEKEKLIKEGKIKKQKPLSHIKLEEIPFEIPENWMWVRLGTLIRVIGGVSYNKADVTQSGIRILRGGNIQEMQIHLNKDDVFLSAEYIDSEKMARFGDVIIVASTGSNKVIGKAGFVDREFPNTMIGAFLRICRPYNLNTANYLRYIFDSHLYKSHICNLSQGTNINNVKESYVTELAIPLPPLAEQKRIAEKIEEILKAQQNLQNALSIYTTDVSAFKSKIIDAGIQGKLTARLPEDGTAQELYQRIVKEKEKILSIRKGRKDKNIKPVGFDTPFVIPDTWKWIRLGDIGFFKKGPFGSALTKSMFVPKGKDTVKVYEQQNAIKKNKNLGSYYITRDYFNSKMNGFEVFPDDIIISCAGTIGESYIMPEKIEQGIINQALMRVTLAPSVDKHFFQYYFDSNLKQLAQSNGNGSAIINIPPFEVLKNWYFPLPPLAEQQRIVERIKEILGNAVE